MNNSQADSIKPLEHVTVLDLTSVISGPYITQALGDMGAKVIKVEPLNGDLTRSLGDAVTDDLTLYFCQYNRNKQSISLNIKTEQGLEVFNKLLEQSDVLVENFRSGVVESLGISYQQLKSKHPELIYASVRGFPEGSELENVRCYDSMIQALGGFAYIQGDDSEPSFVKNAIADKISGISCLNGLLAALFLREKTKLGQRIVVSMLESYFSFMRNQDDSQFMFPSHDSNTPQPDVHRCYRIKDGWASFMFLKLEQFFEFFKSLDREDLIRDHFSSDDFFNMYHELLQSVGELLLTLNSDQVVDLARKTQLPIAPVLNRQQAIDFADKIGCKLVSQRPDLSHDVQYFDIDSVWKFSQSTSESYTQPPKLGEHSLTILKELGYSQANISKMVCAGVVKAS